MGFTDFQAKLFAHELTRLCASDEAEKLTHVLADAQVDLNPHQVEAALFAFRSPLAKGAILADEVGLGKTIEAALLLAQKWAEGKRKLLVVLPANLRKQWSQELEEKFHLPSRILEARTFQEAIRARNLNPFLAPGIVLCSYQFARAKEAYIAQVEWDLVVVDEAHRLRNVYKGSSKIAQAIKDAIADRPKVLLTATPLQNSLLELYGLASILDEHAFGDIESFKARYARLGTGEDFEDLKERLKPICKRTLRRQVLEYVRYTNRHALLQEFRPFPKEQELYDAVSTYLQGERLYALPAGQRQLLTMILRKLLASSTYAIAGTLAGLVERLEAAVRSVSAVDAAPSGLGEDVESADELLDEWAGGSEREDKSARRPLSVEELREAKSELAQLDAFTKLADSIDLNSKGEALLTALRRGFQEAEKARAGSASRSQQKAVIFTESRKTQDYLFRLLEKTEFQGQVVLFNGTNADPLSKAIYRRWSERNAGTDRLTGSPSADMRAALVEAFRDEKQILIATEAAAEGINLQFCNLVVNYDLPWNPQRIEQRIGRCHRYGQQFDVVVVNFLNQNNAADQRVYELLREKFQLFDGVFGASDEVLGTIEHGVDFEKRIADIYQRCRSREQIEHEFDLLQKELEQPIAEGQRDAREKLLDNFDASVVERVRVETKDALDRFQERLWLVTQHVLAGVADFDAGEHSFTLRRNPFAGESIHAGPYRMGRAVSGANTFRVGHPLAQRVLSEAKVKATPSRSVRFEFSASRKRIAALEPWIGRSGWLRCVQIVAQALEQEEQLLLVGHDGAGQPIDPSLARRLFDLPAVAGELRPIPPSEEARLAQAIGAARETEIQRQEQRNGRWFDAETEKLDRWTADKRRTLGAELEELDQRLKELKLESRRAGTLAEKLAKGQQIRGLESKRDEAWKRFDIAKRELEKERDALLDSIQERVTRRVEERPLFTLHWTLT
ncbi:MAG: DEAD/DEAH box helicase family protein [Planctomycetes bacterium]|nr:DEAD/DEAH box helicase family protein [Planctomycetota bacterium]